MIHVIQPPDFLALAQRHPVIDVRSPAEFSQGHIPGAINIALFEDSERATVGTIYVKSGHNEAILKGLDIALPKVDSYVRSARKVCPQGIVLLHCWRGGLRSAMMAEVFSRAGYDVHLLTNGYKAYRRHIRESLARPARIIVLGGFTGSGKTELLREIGKNGEQVIDLEMLACHKGSAFGSLGQPGQPTNEQFENNLFAQWSELDFSRAIWLEDESRMIGRVTLPDPLVEHISSGMLIRVERDVRTRILRLVREYSGFDKTLLAEAINRIAERLGGARAKAACTALDNDRFEEVAEIALSYYDKAYLFSIQRRKNQNVQEIMLADTDMEKNATQVIEFAKKLI